MKDLGLAFYLVTLQCINQVVSCGSDIITDDLRTTTRCHDSTQLFQTKDAKPALQATPFQPRKQYVHSGIYRGARSRQEGRGCHQRSREGESARTDRVHGMHSGNPRPTET